VFFVVNVTEIELVSETTLEELQASEGDQPELTEGLKVAYTVPVVNKVSLLSC